MRTFLGLLLLGAALGCGGGSSSSSYPTYRYNYNYDYGTVGQFKDEAPANRTTAAKDIPMSFVDHDGNPVDVTQYKGKKNVILVVLRGLPLDQGGGFCPNCLAQTKSLATNAAEFSKRDAIILTVFPGPSDRISEFIQQAKATETPKLPFAVLLDKNLVVCEKLGIRGDLAKPSTYILDKKGDVVYAYVGETTADRPSTKAMLAQLDKLQANR